MTKRRILFELIQSIQIKIKKISFWLFRKWNIPISIVRTLINPFGFSILPICSFEKSTDIVLLEKRCKSFSCTPKEENSNNKKLETFFPDIYARKFSFATIISCYQFAIKYKNQIHIPQYYFENIPRISCGGNGFSISRKGFGIIREKSPIKITHGIGLIGLGSSNWYHWLIEILPVVMLAEKLPLAYRNYAFLVPNEYNKYQTFRDSLDALKSHRKIIILGSDKQYQVENFIAIDIPVHGPFNLMKGKWPRISDYRQNENVLIDYRLRILKNYGIENFKPIKKIFLSRKNNRRNFNQIDLERIVKENGFTIVYPEILSFYEQVRLFNSAKYIVGASGAAWANIIFCQKNTFGLTWIFPEYKEFCVYSNLAAIAGMNLSYFFTSTVKPLKSTGEAYSIDYLVDQQVFIKKLKLFLENSE
ncbi:MAG: glycosyltransferase family 61 protein [Desulfobacteraceae bacterium]|nr:MAG: glycosyltransferase family 61 protein [Desulfobacteraceae bacterium]